jgi:hypothetical protein
VLGEETKIYLSLEKPFKGQSQSVTDSLPISQSERHRVNQSASQPTRHPVSHSASHLARQPVIQPVIQLVIQPASQSAIHSFSRSFRQSVSQSFSQSVSQSLIPSRCKRLLKVQDCVLVFVLNMVVCQPCEPLDDKG